MARRWAGRAAPPARARVAKASAPARRAPERGHGDERGQRDLRALARPRLQLQQRHRVVRAPGRPAPRRPGRRARKRARCPPAGGARAATGRRGRRRGAATAAARSTARSSRSSTIRCSSIGSPCVESARSHTSASRSPAATAQPDPLRRLRRASPGPAPPVGRPGDVQGDGRARARTASARACPRRPDRPWRCTRARRETARASPVPPARRQPRHTSRHSASRSITTFGSSATARGRETGQHHGERRQEQARRRAEGSSVEG